MNTNERMSFRRKPAWLKIQLADNEAFSETEKIVVSNHLHTICRNGRCPNRGECWNKGMATFMIGGDICTRGCRFCNTKTGQPLPPDPDEPLRVAYSIRQMRLKHAVITSVSRDDLEDYGATHWVKTIRKVRELNPGISLEVLIPDFMGNEEFLGQIIAERPEIVSHNMETVKRLTPFVRQKATYETSLQVIRSCAQNKNPVKSGVMVGLGEEEDELYALMDDLLFAGCRFLTIGQYLQPSVENIPVYEYLHPSVFKKYEDIARDKGFIHVKSGPLVRSSYHSIDFLT